MRFVMEKYVRVYKNVVPDDFCDLLIAKYEKNPAHVETFNNQQRPSFNQINLHQHEEWKKFCNTLQSTFQDYLEQYKKDCGITQYHWPEKFGFEQFRMKKYLPNNHDQFKSHVDVMNHATARRFLVFFLYCDHNEAGETLLDEYNISIKCEKASLLLFPPLWTYLHTGKKPINRAKYIIGSYLHYI